MKDYVRMGVIGVGNMGTSHVKNILSGKIDGVRLTAACDTKESQRDWIRNNIAEEVHIFESAEELCSSGVCDAVLIATPHYDHPRLVMLAMEHGLHALSEKPAGVYTKQVRELNEFVQKSNEIYAVMFNQRTNPVYRKMKELIDRKQFGEIKRVNWIITDWYRSQAYYNSGGWRATWDGEGGGVLLNQCPHNLDLLQWLCGLPKKVHAFCHEGKWHDIEVEDDVTCYMEFENGATGVFVTTTGDAPGTNRLEITFEKGKMIAEDGGLKVYELEVSEREFCYSTKEGFAKPEGKWIEIELDKGDHGHGLVIEKFAHAILYGSPLVAKGEEGIQGLMLSNAMHLSSWIKSEVILPIDEEYFEKLLVEKRKSSKKKVVEEKQFSTEGSY